MPGTDRQTAFGILVERGWLSTQPRALQEAILERLRLEVFPPKTAVYLLGDPPGGIYGLIRGELAVTIAAGSSGPHLAHLAMPGSWFGEGPFITGKPRRVGLETLTDATLAHLPLREMERLAASNPEMIRAFAQIAMLNVDLALLTVEDLLIDTPARRVAAVLWRSAGGQPGRVIPITQAEIGRLSNTSRKYTIAALRQLTERGLIRQGYNRIEVIDPAELRRFADTTGKDPS